MTTIPALSIHATAPVNDVASTVSMARDLLMACDYGRQSLTLEGAVAKNVLETLISLAERGGSVGPVRPTNGFANLLQNPTVQAERETSVGDAWFMQDTPGARDG